MDAVHKPQRIELEESREIRCGKLKENGLKTTRKNQTNLNRHTSDFSAAQPAGRRAEQIQM